MLLHPAWSSILKRQIPNVKVTDIRSDVTDLTTYTFSACSLGDLGTTATLTVDIQNTVSSLQSTGRRTIAVIVHGKDTATGFSVNSVTIGGVAGTEQEDRLGGTSTINTAIYTWNTDALRGITDTDIVVTWSEAITGCAIGVVTIDNLGLYQALASESAVSSAATSLTGAASSSGVISSFYAILGGATCITSGETFSVQCFPATTASPIGPHPTILYDESNGDFAYAAFWTYSAQMLSGNVPYVVTTDWSGATGNDVAVLAIR